MKIFPHFKLDIFPHFKLPEVHPVVNAAGLVTILGNAAAIAATPQGQALLHGNMTQHSAQITSLIAGGVLAFLPAKKTTPTPQAAEAFSNALNALANSGGKAPNSMNIDGLNIDLSNATKGLEDALAFLGGQPVTIPVQPQKVKLGNHDVIASLTSNGVTLQYVAEGEVAQPTPQAAATTTAATTAAVAPPAADVHA